MWLTVNGLKPEGKDQKRKSLPFKGLRCTQADHRNAKSSIDGHLQRSFKDAEFQLVGKQDHVRARRRSVERSRVRTARIIDKSKGAKEVSFGMRCIPMQAAWHSQFHSWKTKGPVKLTRPDIQLPVMQLWSQVEGTVESYNSMGAQIAACARQLCSDTRLVDDCRKGAAWVVSWHPTCKFLKEVRRVFWMFLGGFSVTWL